MLQAMARAFRLQPSGYPIDRVEAAHRNLEAVLRGSYEELPVRTRAVLTLSDQIVELASRLLREMGTPAS
jgi:hypothetical protein